MQTRRDHLQAYQFATGRLATSLVSGDPGNGDAPMRRSGLGATFGVVAALLLVVVSVIYGLIKPVTTTEWANGTLIVEKETGTRYLYEDGQLHPTANYSSALLVLGGTTSVQQASRASLADIPRGAAVGIPRAPDDVAQPSELLTGGWADCLRSGPKVDEALDFAPTTARPPATGTRMLVADPAGTRYVVWQGRKYAVSAHSSLIALGMDTAQPLDATPAWLAGLPSGPAIAPAAIPGAGGKGRTVAGTDAAIGRLFRTVVSGTSHYYVLEADGLAPLSATEATLIAAEPGARQPASVSSADIAAVPASADTSLMHRVPDVLGTKDTTADGGAALCLLHSADGTRVSVVRETGRAAASGAVVLLPPAHAVLAVPPKNPADVGTPDPYLITDRGVKYELVGQAKESLGYGSVTPRVLPAETLGQIPTGVTLSREQALAAVPEAN